MPYADPQMRRDYAREWHSRRRAEYMADKQCAKCGSTDRLELDHIDPVKKVHHNIWSWSASRRNAELAKCQVLCHDCHTTKTTHQTYGERRHGEVRTYKRGGCRCKACTEAVRYYRRNLKLAKAA